MRFARTLAALGLAALGVGCGPGNGLGGSVDGLFPIDFSRVEVVRGTQAIQVTYFANRKQSVEIVLRLTAVIGEGQPTLGKAISLSGEYAPAHAIATLTHLGADEPLRTLPRVKKGDLHLDRGGTPGAQTSGSFSVSFVNDDEAAYGSGRNAHGSFNAVAADGRPDPCAPAGSCPES